MRSFLRRAPIFPALVRFALGFSFFEGFRFLERPGFQGAISAAAASSKASFDRGGRDFDGKLPRPRLLSRARLPRQPSRQAPVQGLGIRCAPTLRRKSSPRQARPALRLPARPSEAVRQMRAAVRRPRLQLPRSGARTALPSNRRVLSAPRGFLPPAETTRAHPSNGASWTPGWASLRIPRDASGSGATTRDSTGGGGTTRASLANRSARTRLASLPQVPGAHIDFIGDHGRHARRDDGSDLSRHERVAQISIRLWVELPPRIWVQILLRPSARLSAAAPRMGRTRRAPNSSTVENAGRFASSSGNLEIHGVAAPVAGGGARLRSSSSS